MKDYEFEIEFSITEVTKLYQNQLKADLELAYQNKKNALSLQMMARKSEISTEFKKTQYKFKSLLIQTLHDYLVLRTHYKMLGCRILFFGMIEDGHSVNPLFSNYRTDKLSYDLYEEIEQMLLQANTPEQFLSLKFDLTQLKNPNSPNLSQTIQRLQTIIGSWAPMQSYQDLVCSEKNALFQIERLKKSEEKKISHQFLEQLQQIESAIQESIASKHAAILGERPLLRQCLERVVQSDLRKKELDQRIIALEQELKALEKKDPYDEAQKSYDFYNESNAIALKGMSRDKLNQQAKAFINHHLYQEEKLKDEIESTRAIRQYDFFTSDPIVQKNYQLASQLNACSPLVGLGLLLEPDDYQQFCEQLVTKIKQWPFNYSEQDGCQRSYVFG